MKLNVVKKCVAISAAWMRKKMTTFHIVNQSITRGRPLVTPHRDCRMPDAGWSIQHVEVG